MGLLDTLINGAPGNIGRQQRETELAQKKADLQKSQEEGDQQFADLIASGKANYVQDGMARRPVQSGPSAFQADAPISGVPGAGGIPSQIDMSYFEKADPSRVITRKFATGHTVQAELASPAEQIIRQMQDYGAQAPMRQAKEQEEVRRAGDIGQATTYGQGRGEQQAQTEALNNPDLAITLTDDQADALGVPRGYKMLKGQLSQQTTGLESLATAPAALKAKQAAAASQQMGSITTPGVWKILYDRLPPELQPRFDSPEQFDPIKSPMRARLVGMSPDDQQKYAPMVNMTPESWDSRVDTVAPPTGATKGLNVRTKSLVRNALSRGDLKEADMAIKDAADQQGKTETAVATETAKAPIELGIAAQNRQATEKFQSYNQNNGELDKLGKPIEDTSQKIGDLKSLMAEGSPQAWANIPAKLLSLTVGGQGSGLRMNNALLDQELGGAGKWAQLQGQLQQWSLDPKTATKISDTQKSEIRSIVQKLDQKLQSKQGAIDQARQDLIAAPDVESHRRVVLGAHQKLNAIDAAAGAPAQLPRSVSVTNPNNGTVHTFPDQGKADAYKKAAGIP